jgi:aldehyde:ferredoxin oxidoreductase
MGKYLVVDLGRSSVSSEPVPEEVVLDYLGGYGFGCKYIYENQKAKADPLSLGNILGFVTGPLTGTNAVTGNRFTVVGKSPKTGTWGDANCGGNFGPGLKFAGFDAVYFHGASKEPVYLLVENGKASLQSAADLWGLDSNETEDNLKEKHGKRATVACIGPAGEQQSMLSCVMNHYGRAAGRSGLGAVMGSKRLKAIVAVGDAKVPVADAERLDAARKKCVDSFADNPLYGLFHTYGTAGLTANSCMSGDTPIKNWSGVPADFPNAASISDESVNALLEKPYGCWRCPIACGGHVRVKEGKYAVAGHKPEYETLGVFGTLCLNDNLASIVKANDICNRAGLDTIGAGATVAFAIECYESGAITKADTGGLELTWGNDEAIVKLTELIAKNEGIGTLFFNGIAGAQKKLGSKVAEYAMHIGGEELPMHDSRLNPGAATSYHLDATPGRHTQGGSWMLEAGFALPGLAKYYPPIEDKYAAGGKGGAGKAASCFMHSLNCAGLCMFGALMFVEDSFPEFLTAALGTDYSMDRILETGWRIATLRMAFNLREGVSPAKFDVPKRMLGVPPLTAGPLKDVRLDKETQDREYLEAMGWDTKTAAPKAETIEKLGLSATVG